MSMTHYADAADRGRGIDDVDDDDSSFPRSTCNFIAAMRLRLLALAFEVGRRQVDTLLRGRRPA